MGEIVRSDSASAGDDAVRQAIAAIAALDWRYSTEPGIDLEGPADFGHYDGLPPKVELLADGRLVRLLADLAYTGGDGVHWPVPAGAEADGASIPPALWSLIGGPFEGPYRDASIVHDHYCAIESRPWRDTHRMFHDAMRCSGVGGIKAKILYYAVYRFGPRWPGPLESAAFAPPEPLDAFEAKSFAYDAEAIHRHDLSLKEIEGLADARAAESSGSAMALEGPAGSADTALLARNLSIPGGSGTAEDHMAIVARAALLPGYVLERFERKGVRIVACRDSVTDFERSLRGVVPRGWERTGKTWDDVPGAYLPARNRVVVATVDAGGLRAIPGKDSGKHGSSDLLIHEALHGFDFASGHAVLADARFRDARTADFARLDTYEQQAGEAGLQETFAESGARFLVDPGGSSAGWPALHGFWQAGPAGSQRQGITESPAAGGSIGTVQMLDDGALALDLRAESDDGIVGHAQFTIRPDDPNYESLKGHAFRMELEGPAADPAQPRLFYP